MSNSTLLSKKEEREFYGWLKDRKKKKILELVVGPTFS